MQINNVDSISDDAVVSSYIDSVAQNGILRNYVEQGEVGNLLF